MSQNQNATDIDALVGERVRSRRIQARISQAKLGDALGVTFEQVQQYEKGVTRIGSGRLFKIAEVLECNVMDFFESVGGGRTAANTTFAKFLATEEGVAIIDAMVKIKSQALRRAVIDLAEKLAEA
jgi:transcriptional regulator with XRE-family HTH domain